MDPTLSDHPPLRASATPAAAPAGGTWRARLGQSGMLAQNRTRQWIPYQDTPMDRTMIRRMRDVRLGEGIAATE